MESSIRSRKRGKSTAEGLGSAIGIGLGILLADWYFDSGPYKYEARVMLVISGMIGGAFAGGAIYRRIESGTRRYEGLVATIDHTVRNLLGLTCVLLSVKWFVAYTQSGQPTYLGFGSVVLAIGLVGAPWLQRTYVPVLAGLTTCGLNLYPNDFTWTYLEFF